MARLVALLTRNPNVLRREFTAGGAITPGHLLIKSSATAVIAHNAANGANQRMFALENDLVGEDIDDAYASGENVQVGYFAPGEKVNALLAYGENVAAGAQLTSAGDGTLQAAAGSALDRIVGYAAEAVSNLTGGAAVRIEVEVA